MVGDAGGCTAVLGRSAGPTAATLWVRTVVAAGECGRRASQTRARVRRGLEAPLGPDGVRGRAGHDRGGGRRILATSGGSSAPGSGMSPADFVVTSTQNTVAQRTADMDITGSVSVVRGTTIPVSGDGPGRLHDQPGLGLLRLSGQCQDRSTEKELVSGGQAYMNISVDGQCDVRLDRGCAVDRRSPSPSNPPAPSAGRTSTRSARSKCWSSAAPAVVSLGPSTIDGDAVSGYSVTPSQAEIQSALQQEVQAGQLPASALSNVSR